jgi:alpha-amylase/alpha-mannosidase (GH57 family)
MNKKLKLAFLWHMHQPYYKDDKAELTLMPWVFLHAIKDYYDLPWYASEFSSVKATYNLVPSLIYQLQSYIDGTANDKLIDLIRKPIHSLDSDDIVFLQSYLFLPNEKNMIKPLKRYYNLYLKYKAHETISDFSEAEFIDTQVLFLISWCGNYLRENNEIVKRLLEKGQYFSHEEKNELVDTLIAFLPKIFEYYKEQNDSGKITLCTTPYYHPITPLLLDINSAIEAKNSVTMPTMSESFSDFGERNTKMAIEYFEKFFRKKPTGFWPAEGSVSDKTSELFSKNDLKWFCTDEEILFKSINDNHKQNIYKNYNISEKNIEVRFRDHFLSDAIGFEYSQKDPIVSAKEFVNHLKAIYDSCDFSPLVNVILDGENAWEFFPNNAKEFFYELYALFEQLPWIECITMDEISSDRDIITKEIPKIGSGSWINGNFDIWIGSDEKNQAWELLNLTKQDYESKKEFLSQEIISKIEHEFMVALGSDWFWWYGDDHYTVQAKEFDELFRKHLINIYQYMDMNVPKIVYTPIVKTNIKNKFHYKPKDCISPKIDGKNSNYFEWLNSGNIDTTKEFSVMDSTHNMIQNIKYGYDINNLYFFFEGNFKDIKNNTCLKLELDDDIFEIKIIHDLEQNINVDGTILEVFCSKNVVELKISRIIEQDKSISFKFSINESEKIIQSFPIYDDFNIEIKNLKLINWFV